MNTNIPFQSNEAQIVCLLQEQNKINKRIKQGILALLFFVVATHIRSELRLAAQDGTMERFRIYMSQ